jgi:hypothetical protein
MTDKVNKDKQSKLDSFVSQTPKASNKRDQPESSPDNSSPSTQHLDKQARLSALYRTIRILHEMSIVV